MFLFARPPVFRWVLIVIALLVAMYLDLRPASTTDHPFAATDISAGQLVSRDMVLMQPIPVGILEDVTIDDLVGRPLPRTMVAGDPFLASGLANSDVVVPPGWFVVRVPLPGGAGLGAEAIVVLDGEIPTTAEAIVVTAATTDEFGEPIGSVAVPPEQAPTVALAAARGEAIVAVAPPGT